MCSAPFLRALVVLSNPSLLGGSEPTRLSNQPGRPVLYYGLRLRELPLVARRNSFPLSRLFYAHSVRRRVRRRWNRAGKFPSPCTLRHRITAAKISASPAHHDRYAGFRRRRLSPNRLRRREVAPAPVLLCRSDVRACLGLARFSAGGHAGRLPARLVPRNAGGCVADSL